MRSRNLKPGFFKNEDLAELPFEARLLFAGLWCMADREGRLEDRPKRIKAEVFPYDSVDIEKLLDSLVASKHIRRYTVGIACIDIPTFKAHQNPHKNEKASVLPAYSDIGTLREDSGAKTEPLGLIPSSLIPSSSSPKRERSPRKSNAEEPDGAAAWVGVWVDALGEDGQDPPSRNQKAIFGAKVKELGAVDTAVMHDTIKRMVREQKGAPLLPFVYGDCRRETEAELFSSRTEVRRVR